MKIDELLYKTPEMTEDKLLELIKDKEKLIKKPIIGRIKGFYAYDVPFEKCILNEWDKIQEKKSFLTKSQRDFVCSLVSYCLVEMTKSNGGTDKRQSTE